MKSKSFVVLGFIIKMDGFNIEQWCVQNESHIIKCHRRLLTQFPPYLNKTGIIVPGPTWLSFFFWSGFGSQFLGDSRVKNKPGKAEISRGKYLVGIFNKEDSVFWRYKCGLLTSLFLFLFSSPIICPIHSLFVSHLIFPFSHSSLTAYYWYQERASILVYCDF